MAFSQEYHSSLHLLIFESCNMLSEAELAADLREAGMGARSRLTRRKLDWLKKMRTIMARFVRQTKKLERLPPTLRQQPP